LSADTDPNAGERIGSTDDGDNVISLTLSSDLISTGVVESIQMDPTKNLVSVNLNDGCKSKILLPLGGFDWSKNGWIEFDKYFTKQAKRRGLSEKVIDYIFSVLCNHFDVIIGSGDSNAKIIKGVTEENSGSSTSVTEPSTSSMAATSTANTVDDTYIDPSTDLDPYISDRDYPESVVKTIKKTVKSEDFLVRQLLYVGLSAKSNNPLCIGIMAPTSEGKTYAVIESIIKFFPKNDVWKIGSMSPKVIVRLNGMLVDGDTHIPIEGQIRQIKRELNISKDENEKERLKEEYHNLLENSKYLIDLTGKILVFFEPPRPETWDILKPLLSHDVWEMEHPFVEKTEVAGTTVKRIVTRGWPVCIFCSARDESKWSVWPEIQSRFIITSPNMSRQKYLESNMLTAQKMSLPVGIQQQIIVSDSDVDLARRCVSYLQQQIAKLSLSSSGLRQDNPVWIPYQFLGEILSNTKGPDMRKTSRIFSLLRVVSMAKAHIRKTLLYGGERLVVAAVEDLIEVLNITRDLTGVPSHKIKFLREVFTPLYNEEKAKDSDIMGITTKQICDFYKKKWAKGISTDNLKKQFLDELVASDLIGQEESQVNKRWYVYYPIEDYNNNEDTLAAVDEQQKQKSTNRSNDAIFDHFLHCPRIKLPKYCKEIPEKWLLFEILALANHRMQEDKYQGLLGDFLKLRANGEYSDSEEEEEKEGKQEGKGLLILDENGKPMSIGRFCSEYEAHTHVKIRWICKPFFESSSNKIFGVPRYFGIINPGACKNRSNDAIFDQFVHSPDENHEHQHDDDDGDGIRRSDNESSNLSNLKISDITDTGFANQLSVASPSAAEDTNALLVKQWETEREGVYKADGSSDRWYCRYCNKSGDKFFMRAHICSHSNDNRRG
jgi:hypothetical protein